MNIFRRSSVDVVPVAVVSLDERRRTLPPMSFAPGRKWLCLMLCTDSRISPKDIER